MVVLPANKLRAGVMEIRSRASPSPSFLAVVSELPRRRVVTDSVLLGLAGLENAMVASRHACTLPAGMPDRTWSAGCDKWKLFLCVSCNIRRSHRCAGPSARFALTVATVLS